MFLQLPAEAVRGKAEAAEESEVAGVTEEEAREEAEAVAEKKRGKVV